MRTPARLLVVCLSSGLAFACRTGDGGTGTDGLDESTDTDGALEGTGTDGLDESTDTGEDMLPWDEYQALCGQQRNREACEAVPAQSNPDASEAQWCAWVVEVPAQLDGDTCSFGAPVSECRAVYAGDIGCAGVSLDACSIEDLGWSRMDGDTLLIGRGAVCFSPTRTPCTVSPTLGVIGAPECACLCDPSFPA